MKKLILFTLFCFISFSCSKSEDGDTNPPSVLTVDSVTPTNGGGVISYTLPNDTDILYVRAEYTNSNGVDVNRASSYHNNSIEIDGLNQTTPFIITLYVVDEN